MRIEVALPLAFNIASNKMVIDITLALIFSASFAFVIYKAANKVPALILIPDEVISERLRQDSAPLLKVLLRFRDLYREKQIQAAFWRLAGKTLHRLHIVLMRLDNAVVSRLRKIRGENGVINGNGHTGESR